MSRSRVSGLLGAAAGRKLGLRSGQRVYLHHAPSGWDLADPPDGLTDAGPDGPADVIIAFFTAAAALESGDLDGLARRIYPAGALWVAWPRRAGGHRSDITDTVIREHALPIGTGRRQGGRHRRELVRAAPGLARGEPALRSRSRSGRSMDAMGFT